MYSERTMKSIKEFPKVANRDNTAPVVSASSSQSTVEDSFERREKHVAVKANKLNIS